MVKSFEGRTATDTPFAIQCSQVFFGFGVHGKPRIAVRFILLDQLSDTIELRIAIFMFSAGKHFGDLPMADPRVVEPSCNRVASGRRSHVGQSRGKLTRCHVSEVNIFLVGISCRSDIQASDQVLFLW